jgi:serine/threonine-protein kinase
VIALLVIMLTITGTFWEAHHWHQIDDANQMLDQAIEAEWREDWTNARSALLKSQFVIGDTGNARLRVRLAEIQHYLAIADRIIAIRESHALSKDGRIFLSDAPKMYLELFKAESLGGPDNDADQTADRILRLPVRATFQTAIDDWMLSETDPKRLRWLLTVGQKIDDDPQGLRKDLRDPDVWLNAAELRRRIEQRPLDQFPVPFLLALVDQLKKTGEDQLPTLLRAQRAHPNDFWLNLTAGDACMKAGRLSQATEFYTAAVSVRPEVALGWNTLSQSLAFSSRFEEAEQTLRIAVARDPTSTQILLNLTICLSVEKKNEEAVRLLRQILDRDANSAGAHWYLGECLTALGKTDEGLKENVIGAALAPSNRDIQIKLRTRLLKMGDFSDACDVWKRVLDRREEHDGFAELCALAGKEDYFDQESQYLLSTLTDCSSASDREHVGRACLLVPASATIIRNAALVIDRAVAAETPQKTWARPYYLFAQGLAAYRQGDDARAVSIETGEARNALGPAPMLVAAMAEFDRGNSAAARNLFNSAETKFHWDSVPKNREEWIYFILYRQARATLGIAPTSQPFH